MLGAIIGDIVGSRFEWDNTKTKDFEFLASGCRVTDDSIMSLAVAHAILASHGDYSCLSEQTVRITASAMARPCVSARAASPRTRWMRRKSFHGWSLALPTTILKA